MHDELSKLRPSAFFAQARVVSIATRLCLPRMRDLARLHFQRFSKKDVPGRCQICGVDVFLCLFTIVLIPLTWIALAILVTMILIHLAFIVSFCRQCELVAGHWRASPWRFSYFALGVSLMFVSLTLLSAFVFLMETESGVVRLLLYAFAPASLGSFMPIGLSLMSFSIACAVITRIADFYARRSSRTSIESVAQDNSLDHKP